MTTITLPKVVAEEILRRARERGVSVDELLMDVVLKDLDPHSGSRKYIEASLELIDQAEHELERGNLRQASEKIWSACALAIKAHALARKGLRIESHQDLWVYKNEVAREIGEWVRIAFKLADSMHKNFYENLATKEDIQDSLKEVKKLIKTISKALKQPGNN